MISKIDCVLQLYKRKNWIKIALGQIAFIRKFHVTCWKHKTTWKLLFKKRFWRFETQVNEFLFVEMYCIVVQWC